MADDFLLSVTHSEWVRGLFSLKGCVSCTGFKWNTSSALVITRFTNASHGALIEREGLIGSAVTSSRCVCVKVSNCQHYGMDVSAALCTIKALCVRVCVHAEAACRPCCLLAALWIRWIFSSRWTMTGVGVRDFRLHAPRGHCWM